MSGLDRSLDFLGFSLDRLHYSLADLARRNKKYRTPQKKQMKKKRLKQDTIQFPLMCLKNWKWFFKSFGFLTWKLLKYFPIINLIFSFISNDKPQTHRMTSVHHIKYLKDWKKYILKKNDKILSPVCILNKSPQCLQYTIQNPGKSV